VVFRSFWTISKARWYLRKLAPSQCPYQPKISIENSPRSQEMTGEARLVQGLKIQGALLFELPVIKDSRGSLSFAQYQETLPFLPKRYFIVFDVGDGQTRGDHAHRKVHQLLVCVHGACHVLLDDGTTREEVLLNRPELALYLPPGIWATQQDFSRDAVLMVLASEVYDPEEYIKDYQEFVAMRRASGVEKTF
jgi:UDP-2-acetamido-3-amino-2,3-dideoxy-glucuronate N-acetyltransferase